MNFRFLNTLSPLMVSLILFSCDQKDAEEVTPSAGLSTEQVEAAVSANVIYEETFEGSAPFSTAHSISSGTEHAINFVTNPVFRGSKSARFEIRETDPLVQEGKRSEVTIIKGENLPGREMWYSFAAYFPSEGFAYDETQEMISQWYQNGSPATGFRINRDRFYLETGNEPDSRKKIDLAQVTKDTWHEFVFHFVHSHGEDGLIEVWHNGTKILTHKGGNMYNVDIMPKWKVGLYKSSFKYGTSLVDARVAYYDNIRVGNANATFNDMTSLTTQTEPAPTDPAPTPVEPTPNPTEPTPSEPEAENIQKVVSFTLVNAVTDKDVMTLTNGATISLKSLGLKKISIRANTSPSPVGSVRFVLSGAQSKLRTDDVVPYALFGDDRKGDYYSWTPATGSYTLEATPYTGSKESGGTPGEAYSINFKIVR